MPLNQSQSNTVLDMRGLRVTLLILAIATLAMGAAGMVGLIGISRIMVEVRIPPLEISLYRWLLGSLFLALGIAYLYAYRDPIKNRAILKVAIIDLLGEILIVSAYITSTGSHSLILWAGVIFLLGIALILIYYVYKLSNPGII